MASLAAGHYEAAVQQLAAATNLEARPARRAELQALRAHAEGLAWQSRTATRRQRSSPRSSGPGGGGGGGGPGGIAMIANPPGEPSGPSRGGGGGGGACVRTVCTPRHMNSMRPRPAPPSRRRPDQGFGRDFRGGGAACCGGGGGSQRSTYCSRRLAGVAGVAA
eukprot:SAG25_NODE_943_length_4654_cov_5.645225_7_plen_163_part_01